MPVAPNPLLQTGLASSASRPSASVADKSPKAADSRGAGFDQVMSRQGRDSVPARDDKASQGPAQATSSNKPGAVAGGKKEAGASKDLADDGNNLPAALPDGSATADSSATADTTIIDASLVAGQVTDAQTGAQLIQAQAEVVAPVLQAAMQPSPQPAPPVTEAKVSAPVASSTLMPTRSPTCRPCAWRWSRAPRPRGRPRPMPAVHAPRRVSNLPS